VTSAPEPLECRLGEGWNIGPELGGHGILDGHVRPVTAGGAQPLPHQQRLGSHPAGVAGSHLRAIDVASLESGCGSGLNPKGGARDQRLSGP
jgi:hypothetical protein